MVPKRILSVDFDYFYPDSMPYDWGHSENYSPMLSAMLWHARAGNINLMTGEDALESYRPSVPKNFWSRVLKNKPRAYVADSHVEIWELLQGGAYTVVSFDAHHDCGYHSIKPEEVFKITQVNCGNWGLMGKVTGRIRTLQLFYPVWREKAQETLTDTHGLFDVPCDIKYGLPLKPMDFDMVFICRSGAWTPPWYDEEFFKFVESAGLDHTELDDVYTPREPDMALAKQLAVEHKKMLAEFHANKGGKA